MARQGEIKYDVLVIGGANTDYLVRGERLPQPGETMDGEEFLAAGGGKGANQAVAAARLGARVAFVACVGRDQRGDELERLLRAEGVDTSHIYRDPKAQTGVALVMVDKSGEKQIFCAPGANHKLTVARIHLAAPLIRRARVLLMQFEIPMPTVLCVAQIAHAAGVRIALDPAPPAKPPATLLKLLHVIRPNSNEAEALTGIEVKDLNSARRAARKLLKSGVQVVAIQAAKAGDLIVWKEGEHLVRRIKVKTVDATGAGDAFAAAFAVALAENRSYAEAGTSANAAAALATTKFGAMPAMPRRRDVRALLRKRR
jgi:ribokinase